MRVVAILVASSVACGPPSTGPRPPSAPPAFRVGADLVAREELDGSVGAAVRVTLGDDVAFGLVRVPGVTLATVASAPELVLARARGWQDLGARLAATPARALEAVSRGLALLPPCPEERAYAPSTVDPAFSIGTSLDLHVEQRRLQERLRCASSDGAGNLVIAASDLSLRREATGAVTVLATAVFAGQEAAGWATARNVQIEEAPHAPAARLARGRAWRAVVTMLANDPSLAFQAAERGLDALTCQVNHWREPYYAALRERETRPTEAVRQITKIFDSSLAWCAWKYRDQAL